MFFHSSRAHTTRFTPSVEQLEMRAVPASASLAAGVLTVCGTSGNDSIVLSQASGRVRISGIDRTFAAGNVTSILVKAAGGNDTVSVAALDAQPWDKPITITSTGGSDSVKLLDGSTVYFNGPSQTLEIASDGTSTINGQAIDWFDHNIRDAALRQLLRTDFADSAIDRNELFDVFDQVEANGTVSSSEFNDLKKVANNSWLLNSDTYLTDLTRNVVLGNPANARFKGTNLGNLAAGCSAGKLDKLVGKWFLGVDRPNAAYAGITVTYTTAAGTLFGASGPQYTDVHQGAVGDCYFVAALADIAQEDPTAITDMFIVNGDGTYGVRFYQNGNSRYVTVDSLLPTYSGGFFLYANMGSHASDVNNVLWVALAEKAYAQINQSGWLRPAEWGGGRNSYVGIEAGLFSDAVGHIANQGSTSFWVNGTSDDAALTDAVSTGKLIGFATRENPANSQVVGNHQYIVIAYDTSTNTVTLFNPWGIANGSSFPGLLELTLSQLPSSFDYWTVA